MLLYSIVFLLVVIVFYYGSSVKIEDSVSKRERLEMENTEYDYGHNVNHKPNDSRRRD